MSLMWKLDYVSKLPGEVSKETKDKALVEIITEHVTWTKEYSLKRRDKVYSPYSPILEKAIMGETTFKQELDYFENKYGAPKEIQGVKILDGSGWSKFLMTSGIIAIFGTGNLKEDVEKLDNYLERLRPELKKKLYS